MVYLGILNPVEGINDRFPFGQIYRKTIEISVPLYRACPQFSVHLSANFGLYFRVSKHLLQMKRIFKTPLVSHFPIMW